MEEYLTRFGFKVALMYLWGSMENVLDGLDKDWFSRQIISAGLSKVELSINNVDEFSEIPDVYAVYTKSSSNTGAFP